MSKFFIVIFLFYVNIFAFSQSNFIISGKIVDQNSQPLGYATVYIDGSQIRTLTDKDGNYTLSVNNAGMYKLVASMVGYEANTMQLSVKNSQENINIRLFQKSHQLKDVFVGEDKHWRYYYEIFKKYFLGQSSNAQKCTIENPHILHFAFNSKTQELSAFADDFIIIDNKALGYKIRFSLESFKVNLRTYIIGFYGTSYYENLNEGDKQKLIWNKARINTYLGSPKNFFICLYNNSLIQNGFFIYKIENLDASSLPDEKTINKKIDFYSAIEKNRLREKPTSSINQEDETLFTDSLLRYQLAKKYGRSISFLYHSTYTIDLNKYLINMDSSTKLLARKTPFWVHYPKAEEDNEYKGLTNYDWEKKAADTGQQSIVSIINLENTLIDKNGNIAQRAFYFEGYFAWKAVGDELPNDYEIGQ